MSGAIPWSVKGIDPRAREAARDAARRQGLTIGEWLNQAILANEALLADARGEHRPLPARDERLADALRQLAERMEVDDRRNALALAGMDRSLSAVAARVENAQHEAATETGRVADLIDELREAQSVLLEQMRRIEEEDLPNLQAEAGGGERLDRIEGDLHMLAAKAIAAEASTGEALAKLDGAMTALDAKISEAASPEHMDAQALALKQSFEANLETMAQDVASMIADTRADIAGQIVAALGGLQPEEMNAALADMSRRLAAAERRHTQTIEAVSIEIKRLSESMDRRLRVVEARNDDSGAAEVREEIASMSRAVEHRLSEMETREAAAFSRMGEEVGRIAERLDTRVANSEARSAGAIEQVGEQVANLAERLTARQDQLATELTGRIADAEERQGGRLSQALSAISDRLASIQTGNEERFSPVAKAMDGFAARLKALETQTATPIMLPEIEPPLAPAYLDMPMVEPARGSPRSLGLEHEADLHARYAPAHETEPEAELAPEPEPQTAYDSVPLAFAPMERESIYLEDIEEEFTRREEDPAFAPTFELPERPSPKNLDDPFADIEASPPEDEEEDIFWSTGKPEAAPAQNFEAQRNEPFHLPHALNEATTDQPLAGLAEIDDEDEDDVFAAPARDDDEHTVLERVRAYDDSAEAEEDELDRDVFGEEPEDEEIVASATPENYLALARRAAQANAAPKPRGREEVGQGLRGMSRIALWGAAGALAAALAGGVYAYNAQRTALREPARKDAALTHAPPGSIAEGAALAAAEPAAPPAADGSDIPLGPSAAASTHSGPLDAPAAASETPAGVKPMSATITTIEGAAARGDPIAQYELALSKLAGGDNGAAVRLLQQASDKDLAMAQYRLAKLYERGEGVKLDIARARQLTERAAVAGNRKAMHDLGVYYARGEGAAFDETAAFKWFRQAAEYGVADSQFNLGVLYSQGRGVAPDATEAFYWFSIAALSGDADARARAAMISQQMDASAVAAVRARVRGYRAKTMIARANGSFGPQPWAPAATLQAAADIVPRS